METKKAKRTKYFSKFLFIKEEGVAKYQKNYRQIDACHGKEVINDLIYSEIGYLKVNEKYTTPKKPE